MLFNNIYHCRFMLACFNISQYSVPYWWKGTLNACNENVLLYFGIGTNVSIVILQLPSLTSGKVFIRIAASLQAYFITYALRFPFTMKGSIMRGTLSGESRHTASNSTIFGCLKHFILAHSSKKDFTSDFEYRSVLTQWDKSDNDNHTTKHYLMIIKWENCHTP